MFKNLYSGSNLKFIDFYGYECVLYFKSIIEEVLETRNNFGVFDLFHMGRIFIFKDGNFENIQKVLSLRIDTINSNRAKYALILNDRGNIEDDVVIYNYPDKWLIVCNAANKKKLIDIFKNLGLSFEDVSDQLMMIAIQGPKASEVLKKFFDKFVKNINLDNIYFFEYVFLDDLIISRTGYTGEDGFEIYGAYDNLYKILDWILSNFGNVWCGLGARDVLRIEAGLPLYGNEIDDNTNPLEAGLSWAVNVDRNFEIKKYLRYFWVDKGKRIPRKGDKVFLDKEIGYITSGTFSPIFQKPVGMLYLYEDYNVDGLVKVKDIELSLSKTPIFKNRYYKKSKKIQNK